MVTTKTPEVQSLSLKPIHKVESKTVKIKEYRKEEGGHSKEKVGWQKTQN